MPESFIAQSSAIISQYGYLAIGLLAFLECSLFLGLFVPGESFVVLGGVFASRGQLELWIVGLVVFFSAYLGDLVGYGIGYKYGETVVKKIGRKFGYHDAHFQKTHIFFERWGWIAVIAGRYIGVFRSLLPATIGTVRYTFKKYLLFDLLGTVAWTATFVGLGYALGESWDLIERYGLYLGIGTGIIGLLFVLWFLRSKKT